jgi:CelD/BcsL family acetyltransferase involved in cellulose biosynthesis
MIRVECVRDAELLRSYQADWDRLSNGAIMQRFSWLMSWWEAYQASYQLHVLIAFRGDSICGILPLAETKSAWTGCTLVFIGSGKACSDDMGILCDPTDTDDVSDAFAKFLTESSDCCRWDHLNLDGVRDDNMAMKRFADTIIATTGSTLERKASPNCWSASLLGGDVAYKSRLTKRVRRILRNAEIECTSGRSQFEIAETLDQALLFLDDIERLHQSRWKERGVEGCFANRSFSDFLRLAIQAMWNDPWQPSDVSSEMNSESSRRVHVAILRIGGVPAAGAICFRDRDAMDMYLTGMAPEFAESKPGWQVIACCVQRAIALGCDRFDFLRGDEEYKERLGGVPTAQNRWLIPSPRWTSQLRSVAYRTAVSVKTWWRSIPTTPTPITEPIATNT